MQRVKKTFKAIFHPHIAIVALVTVLASSSLIYSLIRLPLLHHISIFSYALSAYAISLIACALPELASKTKSLKARVRSSVKARVKERHDVADPSQIAQLKINIALYGTFFYNSVYAVFTLSIICRITRSRSSSKLSQTGFPVILLSLKNQFSYDSLHSLCSNGDVYILEKTQSGERSRIA